MNDDLISRNSDLLGSLSIIAELKTFPNQAFIWKIIERDNINHIFTLPSGKAIALIEANSDDPFIFVAGALEEVDIDALIKLSPSNFPMIYCNPIYHHYFLARGWDFFIRIQLTHEIPTHISYNKSWEIKQIDNIELFNQCFWVNKKLVHHSSLQAFLSSGKAYALCQDNKVISEAYIEYTHNHSYAEISLATHPNYRGRGAGTQITQYVTEKCKKRGFIPIWSCQIDNKASLRTAIKAGFRIERYYVMMVPEVGNVLSPELEAWINENSPLAW